MNLRPFRSAPILLPDLDDLSTFCVVACDQYSSQPEYWSEVRKLTDGKTSALDFILPEAWLDTKQAALHQSGIPERMKQALSASFFREYPDSYIYVERTMNDHSVRQGLIGMIDLEAYDFSKGSKSQIRATEATILERIPPRKEIREQAVFELPHILLLADDDEDLLLSEVSSKAHNGKLPVLYDFDLMMGGGHLSGYLISEDEAARMDLILDEYALHTKSKYPDLDEDSLVYVVGDGNHSLATAKTIWQEVRETLTEEERETHPARFALAELENIHHDSQKFEQIHRIVTHIRPEELMQAMKASCILDSSHPVSSNSHLFPVECVMQDRSETFWLDPSRGELSCQILQNFLDEYLQQNPEAKIDYIHGEEETRNLAEAEDAIGFILPAMNKSSLFRGVISGGSLPRKTFSMGHANEKRFYLEGKMITLNKD